MAKEAAEHIENRDKSLNKPSIVRRFCAGDQIVLFDGEDGNNIGVGEVKIL